MTDKARAALLRLADALEALASKPKPLSNRDMLTASVNLVHASLMLNQLNCADMADAEAQRLLLAVNKLKIGGIE